MSYWNSVKKIFLDSAQAWHFLAMRGLEAKEVGFSAKYITKFVLKAELGLIYNNLKMKTKVQE